MRLFLDCEYNGFGGELISLALVPEDGGEEFYVVLPPPTAPREWVVRNVMPYLGTVPSPLRFEADRVTAALELAAYLRAVPDPEIVADWPEDLALLCGLLMPDDGDVVDLPGLRLEWVRTPGFSTARNSRVPHNALHDARALREHLLGLE